MKSMPSSYEIWKALPNWCTVEEAASFLECSHSLVYALLREKRLVGWRTSEKGNWKISKGSLATCTGLMVDVDEEEEERDGDLR